MTDPLLGDLVGIHRWSFRYVARKLLQLTAVLALPSALIVILRTGSPKALLTFTNVIAAMLIILGALAGLGALAFPVRIYQRGLRGYSFLGFSHRVRWDEMSSTHDAVSSGLPFIVVTTSRPRLTLWIPRFFDSNERFAADIEAHAGLDHPLTLAVQSDMTNAKELHD